MTAKTARARHRAGTDSAPGSMGARPSGSEAGLGSPLTGSAGDRSLSWPDDPESVSAAGIDFEALAHVLANTCRRGGCCRQYHSIAAHAVIVSEEIEALDGLGDGDRRRLALHALLGGAASAWFRGEWAGSARAAEKTARLASRIETAVRQAAGLDAVLGEEHAELLRFVERMTMAAERRDLFGADEFASGPGSGVIGFPPLKRRIRSVAPDKAAEAWLSRFRALAGDAASGGRNTAGTEPAGGGAPE